VRVNTIFKGLGIRIIEGWEEAEEAEDGARRDAELNLGGN
jgi:hypothetical protein